MSSIDPFTIAIPEDSLTRLKQKLSLADFPAEATNDVASWARGPPLSDIKRLAQYWQDGFDWRQEEAKLNEYPQYVAHISVDHFDTLDVHLIHQRSVVTNAVPLLFLHGWPGSFIEVTKMLPQLTKGGDTYPAFHVVAPSIIGFGFSSASPKGSFHVDQHAEVYHKLMLALGYSEYVVQAGDVGCLVARLIALKYGPGHCKAMHTNSAVPAEPTAKSHPELAAEVAATQLDTQELVGLGRTQLFFKEGNGYFNIQATKPQTISYCLADSPVGLLAWIYEKLHDWADDYSWNDDEILTWISIYYFSRAGPAATTNFYYDMEHREPGAFQASQAYIDVPLGIARFPKDLILLPKLWNQSLGPIVFESDHERGGHFAAWENPEAVVKDLRAMFGTGSSTYGCVEGKNGFS